MAVVARLLLLLALLGTQLVASKDHDSHDSSGDGSGEIDRRPTPHDGGKRPHPVTASPTQGPHDGKLTYTFCLRLQPHRSLHRFFEQYRHLTHPAKPKRGLSLAERSACCSAGSAPGDDITVRAAKLAETRACDAIAFCCCHLSTKDRGEPPSHACEPWHRRFLHANHHTRSNRQHRPMA